MNIRVHCLLIITMVCTVCYGETDYTWTGNGDGMSWTNTSNWNPIGYPGSGGSSDDTALFNSSLANPVNLDTSVTIASLALDQNFILNTTNNSKLFFDAAGGTISVSNNNSEEFFINPNIQALGDLTIDLHEVTVSSIDFILQTIDVAGDCTILGPSFLQYVQINSQANFSQSLTLQDNIFLAIFPSNGLDVQTSLTLDHSVLQVSNFSSAALITLRSAETIYTEEGVTTLSGAISGPGSLAVEGGKTLTLLGDNTYLGNTTVAAGGTLIGTTTSLKGDIATSSGTTVSFTQSTNGTYAGIISGGADVIIDAGSATVIFSGANTYSGETTISSGALSIGALNNINSNIVNVTNGSLVFTNNLSFDGFFDLLGAVTFDTGVNTVTINSIIQGGGSFTKTGSGNLVFPSSFGGTYGGPFIISAGTLSMGSVNNVVQNEIRLGAATLAFTSSFTLIFSATITLTDAGTIDVGSNTNTIPGNITGSGSLTKVGSGTLILTAESNTYSGGTFVSAGTLQGTTRSLQGNIATASGSTVSFMQSVSGTYAGILSGDGAVVIDAASGTVTFSGANTYSGGTTIGTGTLQGTTTSLKGAMSLDPSTTLIFSQSTSGSYAGVISPADSSSTLIVTGGGVVTFSGDSSSFTGATRVEGNSTLNVIGSLSSSPPIHLIGSLPSSPTTVTSGSTLTGTGSVGPLIVEGRVYPGSQGVGTLTANGAVSFASSGILKSVITPSSNNLLVSTSSLNLDGELALDVHLGFAGIGQTFVLAQGASINGTFSSIVVTPPAFIVDISYTATEVIAELLMKIPFINFPYANANERSVGNTLDALSLAGGLTPGLTSVIDSFLDQSIDATNTALDEMHPAALSALAQTQVELGSGLLSLLHHKKNVCFCHKKNQVWVEPFGNWLHLRPKGMQVGFHTTTRGVVGGIEKEFFDVWTLGVGAGYSASDLKWDWDRGYAYTEGAFGAFYSDVQIDHFYFGLSAYAGKDWMQSHRHLTFTVLDAYASSSFSGLDLGTQLNLAYYFEIEKFLIYPYAEIDYLYLNNGAFTEEGAGDLNLEVQKYISSTLRLETGATFRFIDRNREGTMCISPFLGMGYVWERPLNRTPFHAQFVGTSIPFSTWGWDQVWQLIHFKMGFAIVYRCFTLDSEYIANISPEGAFPLVNQRANFRMSYGF